MKGKFKGFLDSRIERPKALVQVNESKNEIYLYDEIGYWGTTADEFVGALALVDPNERLTVCINSPGGDIMDGVAIHNLLAGRGGVDVRIDGFAASIASVIAMAGDSVQMADTATFMIHNPWTFAMGDSRDLRKEAEVLDKLKTTLIKSYKRHTGLSDQEISDLMDQETWFTADEAKENGFITEVINSPEQGEGANNRFDLSIFRNAPERFRKQKAEQPTNSGDGDPGDLRRYFFKLRHQQNLL